MKEYFYNLDIVDPLFHAIVVAKLHEIEQINRQGHATLDDLTEDDELQILRKYSVALYKEYRSLRATFLENMVLSGKSVKMRYSNN